MGADFFSTGGFRHEGAYFVVVTVVRVLCPGVEAPGDCVQSRRASLGLTGGDARPSINGEGAAAVAGPDPVRRPAMETDVLVKDISNLQRFAGTLLRVGVVHDQLDSFVAREVANDFRIDPGNGLELSGPVAFEMRPGQPGCVVRFPLGGHANLRAGDS